MVKISNALSRLKSSAKILVIGDLLLDTYTVGQARRISPEAPVVIIQASRQEHRPGGSGNVILNLLSFGAEVVTMGRVGADWAGKTLRRELEKEGIDTQFIVEQSSYPTPVKNRVISDNQQIVRIDHEQIVALDKDLEENLLAHLPALLDGVKVVAISDYGKGFLTNSFLKQLIKEVNQRDIPLMTDPKGSDFKKYRGTTLIKPNLTEAYAAAKLFSNSPLEEVAKEILEQTQAQVLMITRSQAGISLFNSNGKREDFPVEIKEVKDVTGAGDTVLAMLSFAIANQLSYQEATKLCNLAAGISLEQTGCARVTLSDLALRLLQGSQKNKVFDQEHLFILQEALNGQPFHLLILSKFQAMTLKLFQIIKELSQIDVPFVLYLEDLEGNEPLLDFLASLQEVRFILCKHSDLKDLTDRLKPVRTYLYGSEEEGLLEIQCEEYLDSKCANALLL